jgi:hypothetical protein
MDAVSLRHDYHILHHILLGVATRLQLNARHEGTYCQDVFTART